MATPDYLQQVIVSGRNQAGMNRRMSAADSGLFRRPSVTSSVWATLDILTVVVATMLALRFRVTTPPDVSTLHVLPHLIESSPNLLPFYVAWFSVCLVFFTRSYGLYGPIQHRSGLHEQRMTVQASLTLGTASVRDTLLVEWRVDIAGCGGVDGRLCDCAAMPATSAVAADGVSAFPCGGGDAQCSDCRRGTSGAGAEKSH